MRLSPATWPWPAPALLAWLAPWGVLAVGARAMLPTALTLVLALALAVGLALQNANPRRRWIAAVGFPLSAALLAGASGSPWAWLLAAVLLALIYPLRAWKDAPLFPTPPGALAGLAPSVNPPPQRVLDAGCGLGDGLRALQAVWPQAELHGIELSAAMAWMAALRCRAARVRRGDMWAGSWAGYDLVYLFQRPESMPRAWAKACAEMRPGSWVASLEFQVPDVAPHAALPVSTGSPAVRRLWVYRLPERGSSRSTAAVASR